MCVCGPGTLVVVMPFHMPTARYFVRTMSLVSRTLWPAPSPRSRASVGDYSRIARILPIITFIACHSPRSRDSDNQKLPARLSS